MCEDDVPVLKTQSFVHEAEPSADEKQNEVESSFIFFDYKYNRGERCTFE